MSASFDKQRLNARNERELAAMLLGVQLGCLPDEAEYTVNDDDQIIAVIASLDKRLYRVTTIKL